MTTVAEEARANLRVLAVSAIREVLRVGPTERMHVIEDFNRVLREEMDTRELLNQVQGMFDDGCPNCQDY